MRKFYDTVYKKKDLKNNWYLVHSALIPKIKNQGKRPTCAAFSRVRGIEIVMAQNKKYEPLPYYIYPRSSISKTPLMLANHAGIIDTGYRGNLMTAVRNLSNENNYTIEKHSRLFQICSGDLKPFFVIIVDKEDLSVTERNEGGFGSTGK